MAQDAQRPEWIARGHPSATLMMGYLAAAQLMPTLFLGLAGGLLADRVNRKKLLLITQFILMLIAAGVATASYLDLAMATVGGSHLTMPGTAGARGYRGVFVLVSPSHPTPITGGSGGFYIQGKTVFNVSVSTTDATAAQVAPDLVHQQYSWTHR